MRNRPQVPEEIGGYVLAGGRSSRMGRDKALLELGGRPLVDYAVNKLRQVCKHVHLLSDRAELARYAPLVPDLHPGCGPMGGMEAGLAHSTFDWNVFLAVDMPFLPASLLGAWVRQMLLESKGATGGVLVRMFQVGDRPQPGFCLLHRDVRPFLTASLERGEYKLMPALEEAGSVRSRFHPDKDDCQASMSSVEAAGSREGRWGTTEAQWATRHLWFANLNTPEELSEAERHVDAVEA